MAHASVTASGTDESHSSGHGKLFALALGSVGVVYGDIGTSPLYALKEAVHAANEHHIGGSDTILGILSIMVWSIVLIVTVKYVMILLRADNKGEGGTFALMALGQSVATRSAPVIAMLGIAGAAFFYGDAIITPAISVLSAVEGLEVRDPAQPARPQGHSSALQSLVSRMSLMRTRKLAAYAPSKARWSQLMARFPTGWMPIGFPGTRWKVSKSLTNCWSTNAAGGKDYLGYWSKCK